MSIHFSPVRRTALLPLAAAIAWTLAAGCSSNDSPRQPPAADNTAPAVSAIGNRTADQDTVVGPIDFGVSDVESPNGDLTLTASADVNSVFPIDGIVLSGTGTTRSLTLTPLEGATGTTSLSIVATDPQGLQTTRTFSVVLAARQASVRDTTVTTFAKTETGEPTALNGLTFDQDADDPATFDGLIPPEQP